MDSFEKAHRINSCQTYLKYNLEINFQVIPNNKIALHVDPAINKLRSANHTAFFPV